jgi:thermitase
MPRRLIYTLLFCSLMAVTVALSMLFQELTRAPEALEVLPSLSQASSKPPRAEKMPLPLSLPKASHGTPEASQSLLQDLQQELQHERALPNEALLTFRTQEALAAFQKRAAEKGLEILQLDPRLLLARVRWREPSALPRELAEHAADYSRAGANYWMDLPGLPPAQDEANAGGRSPFQSQGLDLIGAPANRNGWGAGVTVAVVDSGISAHPSLQSSSITHIDLVKDGKAFDGHGTAMASLISGSDARVSGIAPSSKLLDVRVADAQGASNTSLLSSGIVQAVEGGARVINVSMGSTDYSPVLEQAVRYAQSRGAVIIAAAGNEQQSALSYPAAFAGVVSVAAVDAQGRQAWFSNSGEQLTVAAPGVGIVSGFSDQRFVIGSGTSQAAAITSGVAAYLVGRGYLPQNIPTVLQNTARPTGAPRSAVGAGLLRIP